MAKYLKFMAAPLFFVPVFYAGLILGGSWMWFGLICTSFIVILGDLFLGEDVSEPEFSHPWLLQGILFLAFPILAFLLFFLAWTGGAGQGKDFLGFGWAIQQLTGYDLMAAHSGDTFFHYVGAVLSVGLVVAGYGTNVAHELTHRTNKLLHMITGRWLLSMSCNADFSIEHVFGHHANIGTAIDPATAKRGQTLYSFFLYSTLYGHISAWKIEMDRLLKKGCWILSPRNAILRGYVMSLAWIGLFYIAGGMLGIGLFLGQAFFARLILEVVNYIEHYGLVRIPGQPVKHHHSWNTNRRTSSYLLFSLTRHSAHHERAQKDYWKLNAYPEAPIMPLGYLGSLYIALFPPLWNYIMIPRLLEWDRKYASEEERKAAEEQNRKSGLKGLMAGGGAAAGVAS